LAFGRIDSAVLYINIQHYTVATWLLPDIQESIVAYLEQDVPLFTYKYAPGIGVAEHPVSNESFGMKMMNIVATGVLNAQAQNLTAPSGVLAFIENEFTKNDIDFNAPFLNKGSRNNLTVHAAGQ
jgi:hypothetical protein